MRKKLSLALVGIAAAASFAPLGSASAYCDRTWRSLTDDCNPCYTLADLSSRPLNCPA